MDNSPDYVQMCRQAKEIQEQWKPQIGDFYESNGIELICTEVLIDTIIKDTKEHKCEFWIVWLPRQDQLIQLTKKRGNGLALLISLCLEFDYSPKQEYFIPFETIEQVLLAHVMHFNYKKTYNGSDWVAE